MSQSDSSPPEALIKLGIDVKKISIQEEGSKKYPKIDADSDYL